MSADIVFDPTLGIGEFIDRRKVARVGTIMEITGTFIPLRCHTRLGASRNRSAFVFAQEIIEHGVVTVRLEQFAVAVGAAQVFIKNIGQADEVGAAATLSKLKWMRFVFTRPLEFGLFGSFLWF